MKTITNALVFLTAFLCTALLLPRFASIALRVGLVDLPSRRKVHHTPRPLVGGLGMAAGITLSALVFIPLGNLRGFYLGFVLLVMAGLLDDLSEISPRAKFALQIAAALVMAYLSKAVLLSFGDLMGLGSVDFGMLAIGITIVGTVGVINAVNMSDGLDGLAGTLSLIAFATLAFLSFHDGQKTFMMVSLAFSGALTAFLIFNLPPAQLFMGDVGSATLGFAFAFLSISLTQRTGSTVPPIAPLLTLAVPITDTLLIMSMRVAHGKSPFHADKYHLHHVLLRLGYTHRGVLSILGSLSAAFATLAVLCTVLRIPEHYFFYLFLIYFALMFTAALNLKKLYKRLKRSRLPFKALRA